MERPELKNLIQYLIGVLISAAFISAFFYGFAALNIPAAFAWLIVAAFIAVLIVMYLKQRYIAIGMLFGVFLALFVVAYFIISYFVDPSW